MVREELAPRGFWGRVQGVGLIGWVNTRPMVRGTPSARCADAREARFIGEFQFIIKNVKFKDSISRLEF